MWLFRSTTDSVLLYPKQPVGTYATGTGSATNANTGDNANNTQYSGLAASKQDALVSATNIKTVNGSSVLGSGNLVVGGAAAFVDITGQPTDNANLSTALSGKLATNGNGSSLTNLTASQVGLGNVTNESKATLFTSPTFTGTVTLPASTSLTTPVIGVSTGTSLAATGLIKSSGTAGVGYAAGAGGTVTQATNKATGVTLNKISGQITMNGAALAAAAEVAFTLTNSTIASTDVVIVNIQSVGTAVAYFVNVGAVANGSCSITLGNASAGSLSQAIVLNFAVIKSVSN